MDQEVSIAGFGTFPPFPRGWLNGRSGQQRTLGICPSETSERQRLGRLLNGTFWEAMPAWLTLNRAKRLWQFSTRPGRSLNSPSTSPRANTCRRPRRDIRLLTSQRWGWVRMVRAGGRESNSRHSAVPSIGSAKGGDPCLQTHRRTDLSADQPGDDLDHGIAHVDACQNLGCMMG